MRNKLSALQFHDKIFIAYGFVFLVMFGVVFGSTSFLTRLAFKRDVDAYIEKLEAQISNEYQRFLNDIQKEVHATATDVRLHDIIEREESSHPYLPGPQFDLLEYGTADGKLLYPDTRVRRRTQVYTSSEDQERHIQLRRIPEQSHLGLQYVVQVTEAGEWGFVRGGYLLQEWLETKETLIIQSDEHPIFLVGKPQMSEVASFNTESNATPTDWLPLNNASRSAALRRSFQSLSSSQEQQKISLQGTEETDGRSFTAFRITPFNSPFATTREAPPVELFVGYSHERQMKWQQQLTLTLLLSGIGGLVLVYLISYIISRRITRPIAVLREGVAHIAAGDLDHRVKIRSRNEVGQLAEGFNQMARDLKQGLEERMAVERAATWRDVARQVAHEIKNPLFPIRLSVENLQQAKSNPEVFEQIFSECTNTVIEEVDRIGKLIDEFHQFARMPKPQKKLSQLNNIVRYVLALYTGRQIPDLEQETDVPMAISEISEDGNPELLDSAEKSWLENISKINVETELDTLPHLFIDREQVARALGNLLKNAIEAMPEGGILKVRTSFTPSTSQEDSNGRPGELEDSENVRDEENVDIDVPGTVTLEIEDTGCGMSNETMANIFVPYYTTKSEVNGTGLGMPIVGRIVAEHGAKIDFQSEQGVGTAVRVHFPCNQGVDSEELASEIEELMPLRSFVPELETIDQRTETED